jgi:hypothetical protein
MLAQEGLAKEAGSRLSSHEMSLLWLLVRGGFEKDELSPCRGYHRRIRPKSMNSFLNQMTSMLAVQYCGEIQR